MKKTILSLAVILASMGAISASAQTQETKNCKNATECTKDANMKKGPAFNPFDGLNLTEQQQSALKALKPDKSQCKSGDNAKKEKGKEMTQAEKQAQRKEAMEKRVQGRRDYLAKVKTILTPEQDLQFLENNFVDQSMKQAPGHGKMAKGKDGKGRGYRDHAMRGEKR